jgi:hypothetical protein
MILITNCHLYLLAKYYTAVVIKSVALWSTRNLQPWNQPWPQVRYKSRDLVVIKFPVGILAHHDFCLQGKNYSSRIVGLLPTTTYECWKIQEWKQFVSICCFCVQICQMVEIFMRSTQRMQLYYVVEKDAISTTTKPATQQLAISFVSRFISWIIYHIFLLRNCSHLLGI